MQTKIRLTILVLAALLSFHNPVAADTLVTAAFSDFGGGNDSAFQKNGDTALSGTDLRLTRAIGGVYGTAFYKKLVSLSNGRSFSSYFTFRITSPSCFTGVGADGLAFVVQTDSNTAGSAGGGIGYAGINPSVAIEFDTFTNGDVGDPDNNHIGISINGNTNSVATATAPSVMTNGTTYHVWVDYNGSTDLLEVRFASSNTRPGSATLSYSADLESVIGSDVYVGFTAATGGCWEQHVVRSFYFNNDIITGGITPGTVTYASAPSDLSVTGPASLTADGLDAGTYTFTAANPQGTPYPNAAISFSTSTGSLNTGSSTTDSNGQATTTLTSSTSGSATVRGQVVGGVVATKAVTLVAPTPTITPTPVVTPPVVSTPSSGGVSSPTPPISGTAPAGNQVKLYIDGVYVATVTADSNGTFTYQVTTALAVGSHQVTGITINGNGIESALSVIATLEIRREAVLDFDGDGVTDVTATQRRGSTTAYRSLLSTTDAISAVSVDGSVPVPADYDSDKKWDYATVKLANKRIEWNVRQSTTLTNRTVTWGSIGDTVLFGCRFGSSGEYVLSTIRGRAIRFRSLDGSSRGYISFASVGEGDVLGCGDVNGDGKDELIVATPNSMNARRAVAFDRTGHRLLNKSIRRFGRGFIVRSASSGAPLLGAVRGIGKDRKSSEIRALRGTFNFPLFYLPGVLDVSSGSFESTSDSSIVTGVTWQEKRGRSIARLLSNETSSTKVLSVPNGYLLTRPQGKQVVK